tara:strand:- start:44 stop:2110 length:2067 start_codon:yes stop_codon:yes gene_type:complete
MENSQKKSPQDARTAALERAGGTQYPRISSKSSRQKRSPRKEFIEQNRLRLSFERRLRQQLQGLFVRTGRDASRAYQTSGSTSTSERRLTDRLSEVLIKHYRSVIDEFGLRVLRDRKQDGQFEAIVKSYIRDFGGVRITQISNTTMRQINRVVSQGLKDGLGVAAIGKNIRDSMESPFSRYRANTIARTETHSAASYGNHQVNASLNIPNQIKRWVAVADARARPTHVAANGTEVPLDEDFIVGGVAMSYTGDPRGGAKNVINCRCVTLYIDPEDEIIQDENTVVAQKPIKEPLPERNRDAPITPLDLAGIKILKKSEAKKQLDEQLSEAANDDRYVNKNKTHYSSGKVDYFGRAVFSRDLTDESASVILAIKPELDDMTDRLNLPRIRSIVVKSSNRYNMAMGDGILYINHRYINDLVGMRLHKSRGMSDAERQRLVLELAEQGQPDLDEYRSLGDRMQEIMKQIDENRSLKPTIGLNAYLLRHNELAKEYNDLGRKRKRLRTKIEKNKRERDALLAPQSELEVSDWNPSKPIKDRPFSGKQYIYDPLERVRHTFYHEMGHQIHQTYKLETRKSHLDAVARAQQGRDTPLPARMIEPEFGQTSRPLDAWLDRSTTEKLLYGGGRKGRINDPEKAKLTWSEYGNHNGHEWFAENNANYWRGDRDKVDPKFITLMKNILEGKDIDDTSL